jgi:hypothetical protein
VEGPILGAVGFPKTTTTTITTTIDLPYIPPLNPKLVNRMVGYLEYGRALYLLDQLAKNCSARELEVIDEIIRSRDEHAVFVNRSRILERESSALSEQPQGTDDEFERRGLAWLTALARVELGALAAGLLGAAQRPDRRQHAGGADQRHASHRLRPPGLDHAGVPASRPRIARRAAGARATRRTESLADGTDRSPRRDRLGQAEAVPRRHGLGEIEVVQSEP